MPPPSPEAVLLVTPLPVSVTAPAFRMPPPPPTAWPLSRVTEVRVRAPVAPTSAIRKGSAPERVMTVLVPVRLTTVVMRGSPSGPCAPVAWLVVRV
jgi:hypothetical protein